MRTVTIAICEDNPDSLSYICSSVRDVFHGYGITSIISTYQSSQALLNLVQEGTAFQLYFLDIDMPKVNGLTLDSAIRENDSLATIIYVSGREEYVFEAIHVQPFRFIRKSRYKEDLKEALSAYMMVMGKPNPERVLTIESPTETHRFPVDDIRYIKAEDNYLRLYLRDQSVLLRLTMANAEKELSKWQFLRIHKSYLVNFTYIHVLRKGEVLLEDGTTLPVSRHRQAELMKQFKEYLVDGDANST